MTSADLLWACRRSASAVDLVGADVVEVIPTAHRLGRHHRAVADRIVREMLTGIALRRQGSEADDQRRVRPRTTVTLPNQPKL